MDENSLRRKHKSKVFLKTERFGPIDSAVIISNAIKAVQNWNYFLLRIKYSDSFTSDVSNSSDSNFQHCIKQSLHGI